MSLLDQKVQGEPTAAPVSDTPETPAAGGVATPATPAQPPQSDALAERQRLEKDINNIKSTFQRREAQLAKEAREREQELLRKLEETKVSGMDEEARKAYETQRAARRVQELETQLQEEQRKYQEYTTFQNALLQFRSAGVPENALITDGTLDDLVGSGWDWLTSRVRELESRSAVPATPPPPTLPDAPPVDTGRSSTTNTKPGWPELIQKYGSREKVYELVEARRLSPDIIP